jgi:hypothetical protein
MLIGRDVCRFSLMLMVCEMNWDWNPGHSGERADCNRVRAIQKMPMGRNGGVLAHDQLRPTIGFAAEMPRVRAGLALAQWETGNPIAAPDGRVRSKMQKLQAFCHGQIINGGVFFHDQTGWRNPGNTDVGRSDEFGNRIVVPERGGGFSKAKGAK